MRRFITVSLTILLLAVFAGCSGGSLINNSSSPGYKVLRQTRIGSEYSMYQLELTIPASEKLPLKITLDDGYGADVYFYVEKGDDDITFLVADTSPIYTSNFKNLPDDVPVSDRYSVSNDTGQIQDYTFSFTNNGDESDETKSTIFFEIIYEGTEPIFSPVTD